jgi:LCP family protein required for cell wall assembly
MRTTLKRGVGRGAAANGSNRAALPPGPLGPVTVYRQPPPPPRRRGHLVLQILGWAALVLCVLVGGTAAGAYLYLHESVAAVAPESKEVKEALKSLDVALPGQPAVALVIGYDHRADEGKNTPSRSDTLMLVRADPDTKAISLLSFPRDLSAQIDCPGHTPFVSKINAAYATCGPKGALRTVRNLTGVPINYIITVNFRGFRQLVDKLGGVWMDVDRRYYNDQGGPGGYAKINLQPGYQLLTGGSALDYVRYRHTDSDLFRLARQQLFVSAMRQQVSHSLGPTSIPGLVNEITHHQYVEVARGGRELNLSDIYRYATFAWHLPHGHVFQVKIQNVTGYNELSASQSSIDQAVQQFMNPDVQASTTATEVALGRKIRKQRKRVIPPKRVTLTVLNGNGVAGAAGNASYLLGQKGYSTVVPSSGQPANAPNWNYFHSKVYYDPSRPKDGKVAAAQVARLVGSADVEPLPQNLKQSSNNALLTVIVGSTFHGHLAPIVIPQPLKRQPANVRRDPAETRSRLFAVRKRLPFTLQYPTFLERNSSLDDGYGETPLRIYPLAGKPALRLTFRTGANEYWGIQETQWADAPVLADKSITQRINGREYDLYYSGSNLHMVVLRDRGATYWVVNTLLNSLSNETMLAIARGLRPLPR